MKTISKMGQADPDRRWGGVCRGRIIHVFHSFRTEFRGPMAVGLASLARLLQALGMPTAKPTKAAAQLPHLLRHRLAHGAGGAQWPHVEQATRCECIRQQQGERLLEAARIPRRYRHCELSNFEHEGPFRSLASAHMASLRFVEEFPLESAGLLLTGPIGCGKTHLAVGIAKELIVQEGYGMPVLRLSRAAQGDSELLQRLGAGDRDGSAAAGV